MYNRNDILRILLEAGFLYDNLSFPVRRSLPEIALDVDNLEAFFILISSFQFKIMEALSDEDKADILKTISELSEERQQELKKTIISIWQNDRVNHQFYLGFFNEDEFERALDNPYSAYDLFVKAKEGIESGIIDNGLYEGLIIMSIEKQFEYLSRAIRAKKNDVLLVLLTAGFADALYVEKIDSLRVLAHENQNEIAYIMLVPYELKK